MKSSNKNLQYLFTVLKGKSEIFKRKMKLFVFDIITKKLK